MKRKKYNKVQTQHHMSICIKGLLNRRKKITFFDDSDTGLPISDKEARATLKLELAKGHTVYPVGNCYRFDPIKKGCLGHIKAILPNEDKMDEIELEWALFKQGKKV